MADLKYTVIQSRAQYDAYCVELESLLKSSDPAMEDEVELLTLLIENWDRRQNKEVDSDPVEVIHLLMKEHGLKATQLASLLGLSPGALSNILNYRRRLTADNIRFIANHFKIKQEILNKAYPLASSRKDSQSLVV